MHAIWEDDSPHARFMQRLHWDRACMFLKDDDYLASLRHRHELYNRDVRVFGHVFDMMGIDYFQEVYRASERLKHKQVAIRETVISERPLRFPNQDVFSADDLGIRKAAAWLPSEIVETILLFSEKEWNNKPEIVIKHTPCEYNSSGEYGFFSEHNVDLPSVRII